MCNPSSTHSPLSVNSTGNDWSTELIQRSPMLASVLKHLHQARCHLSQRLACLNWALWEAPSSAAHESCESAQPMESSTGEGKLGETDRKRISLRSWWQSQAFVLQNKTKYMPKWNIYYKKMSQRYDLKIISVYLSKVWLNNLIFILIFVYPLSLSLIWCHRGIRLTIYSPSIKKSPPDQLQPYSKCHSSFILFLRIHFTLVMTHSRRRSTHTQEGRR